MASHACTNLLSFSSLPVGQLPVIHPGEAFEYMSGVELINRHGMQKGSFFFAPVPTGTPSAILGSDVDALTSKEKFQVVVKPFLLEAPRSDPANIT